LNQGNTTAVEDLIVSKCALQCAGAAATCLAAHANKVQLQKLLESTKDYCKVILQSLTERDDSKSTESFVKNWKDNGLECPPQDDKANQDPLNPAKKEENKPQNDKDPKKINQKIPTPKLKWGAKDGDADALKALAYFKDTTKLATFFERNKSLMTGKRVYDLGTKLKSAAITGDSAKIEFNLTDADKEQYKNDSTTPIVTSDKFVKFAEAVATEAAKPSSKLPWSELKTIIGDDFAPQNENGSQDSPFFQSNSSPNQEENPKKEKDLKTDPTVENGEGKDYRLSRTSTQDVNVPIGENVKEEHPVIKLKNTVIKHLKNVKDLNSYCTKKAKDGVKCILGTSATNGEGKRKL
jgi:hypothetical protein